MQSNKISEYKVLKSNAGYYIGRTYGAWAEPYDRATEYYRTYQEAEADLELFYEVNGLTHYKCHCGREVSRYSTFFQNVGECEHCHYIGEED